MSAVPTNVTLTVTYANQEVAAAVGTVVTTQQLTLTDPTGANTVTSEAVGVTSITLSPTLPGSYTAALQAQDQNGNQLGSPASVTFAISAATTVTLSLPATLAASVAGAPSGGAAPASATASVRR